MLLGPWLLLEVCKLSVLVLHESFLVPVLMYGTETMILKEKERSRIRWTTSEVCWILGRWIKS